MIIAAKGQPNQIIELRELISDNPISSFNINEIDSYDIIFDLDFDDTPEQIQYYLELEGKLIILGAVKVQLEELLAEAGRGRDFADTGRNVPGCDACYKLFHKQNEYK